MEINTLISLSAYIQWLEDNVTVKLRRLNKDLKKFIECKVVRYEISPDHKGGSVEINFDTWKEQSQSLIDSVNKYATELYNMNDIPMSDDYQSAKDNYKSEVCYSEFLMSIITNIIENDPRVGSDMACQLTQAMTLPIAKDPDEDKRKKIKASRIPNNILGNSIITAPQTNAKFGLPDSDAIGERLSKEIKAGLNDLRKGLR